MKKYLLLICCICLAVFLKAQRRPTEEPIFKYPDSLQKVLAQNDAWGDTIYLGNSKNGVPIYAYYYNRSGTDKAMVMAGVHGSEFYGVDVVYELKARIDTLNPAYYKWTIIIIPELFIDNIIPSRTKLFEKIGNRLNNYINENRETVGFVDPNRQMPKAGNLYKNDTKGAKGHSIELENRHLLKLVQVYNPTRIASVHCKNEDRLYEIGIYADPRTYSDSIALGFSDDSALAVNMALVVKENDGRIIGNFQQMLADGILVKRAYPNAIYPQDPEVVPKDSVQKRNSVYKQYNGKVSFGTWASTRIGSSDNILKNAATMLTIELPQYYSFFKGKTKYLNITELNTNTNAYVKSLLEVFLSNQ